MGYWCLLSRGDTTNRGGGRPASGQSPSQQRNQKYQQHFCQHFWFRHQGFSWGRRGTLVLFLPQGRHAWASLSTPTSSGQSWGVHDQSQEVHVYPRALPTHCQWARGCMWQELQAPRLHSTGTACQWECCPALATMTGNPAAAIVCAGKAPPPQFLWIHAS